MTLSEAANHIGDEVLYQQQEAAIITGVGTMYVFVQYANSTGAKATCAEDLTLL